MLQQKGEDGPKIFSQSLFLSKKSIKRKGFKAPFKTNYKVIKVSHGWWNQSLVKKKKKKNAMRIYHLFKSCHSSVL